MTKGHKKWGLRPTNICRVGFKLYNSDFIILFGRFDGVYPLLGDIRPFLRPDLGGKLGDGYQLQIYINHAFLRSWGQSQSRFMLKIFQAKAIFMQGSY
jgi:hypothetical protein